MSGLVYYYHLFSGRPDALTFPHDKIICGGKHMDEWTRPDPSRMALLTIDIQREFQPGGPSGREENAQTIPAAARLAKAFRKAAKPLIHIVRIYLPDASNVDLCRRSRILSGNPLLLPGSLSSQIAAQLLPDPSILLDHRLLLSGAIQNIGPSEYIIYKPRFGAFFGTPLMEHLETLGVDTLAVTGSNYPNCPRATIYEACDRDYRVIAVTDGISLLDEAGKRELEAIGVNCLSSTETVSLLF
jgi:nicotinamidase-related amidase